MFEGLAVLHIWIPYDQTGLIIELYNIILVFRLSLDLRRGRNRWSLLLTSFHLFWRWSFQDRRLSKIIHRYFVSFEIGMLLFLSLTVGQTPGRRAKVTREDLLSLIILIIQLLAQLSKRFKCFWRCCAAIVMSSSLDRLAVSSANVASRVLGMSTVKKLYRWGERWKEIIGLSFVKRLCVATSRKRPVRYFLSSSAEAIVSVGLWTWCKVECLDRKPNRMLCIIVLWSDTWIFTVDFTTRD